jgi:hypothetical protein
MSQCNIDCQYYLVARKPLCTFHIKPPPRFEECSAYIKDDSELLSRDSAKTYWEMYGNGRSQLPKWLGVGKHHEVLNSTLTIKSEGRNIRLVDMTITVKSGTSPSYVLTNVLRGMISSWSPNYKISTMGMGRFYVIKLSFEIARHRLWEISRKPKKVIHRPSDRKRYRMLDTILEYTNFMGYGNGPITPPNVFNLTVEEMSVFMDKYLRPNQP